jgi:hypothetical protein
MSKEKAVKKVKLVKEQRKAVEPTEANLKTAREAATVLEYSVPKIRKALNATWSEAVAIRHALLKAKSLSAPSQPRVSGHTSRF